MKTIITILGLSALTNLWVQSYPTSVLRHKVYKSLYKEKDYTNKWHWMLIECTLCLGFWVGLIGTQDILLASIISITSEFICQKLSSGKL